MEQRGQFKLFKDLNEFKSWLFAQKVSRKVYRVQEHHTWLPDYAQFKGSNQISMMEGMKDYHVNTNKFADIAQHFSVFPDGSICTGRSLESDPAGIYGANAGSICIENIGNFDKGGDTMTVAQKNAIVFLTACLCMHFNIPIDTNGIIYHHWFDQNTGLRTNGTGVTKTCPGNTGFFGGNTVEAAKANFIPLVVAKVTELKPKPAPTMIFKDVPDTHMAAKYIKDLKDKGIIGGYTDGTFKPDQQITRAEVAIMISKALAR